MYCGLSAMQALLWCCCLSAIMYAGYFSAVCQPCKLCYVASVCQPCMQYALCCPCLSAGASHALLRGKPEEQSGGLRAKLAASGVAGGAMHCWTEGVRN
jgi:hypothetical protein